MAFADSSKEERIRKERESLEKAAIKHESPREFGLDLSYAPRKFTNYNYVPTVTSDKIGYAATVRVEWLPYQEYGKVGVGGGLGFSVHPNTIVVPATGSTEAQLATLYTAPIEIGVSYRGDFIRNQILVPFITLGGSLTLIKQNSAFGYSRAGLQQFKGLEYGGGIEFNLNPLEPSAARTLDQSMGINSTMLVAEYHVVSPLGTQTYDLSRKEWRLGMRFEF
jgi:hypothetical protein